MHYPVWGLVIGWVLSLVIAAAFIDFIGKFLSSIIITRHGFKWNSRFDE